MLRFIALNAGRFHEPVGEHSRRLHFAESHQEDGGGRTGDGQVRSRQGGSGRTQQVTIHD